MDYTRLPPRMFAKGHEPDGTKVTAYHKPQRVQTIMNALDEDEARVIKESSFGKFLTLAEKPTYSGRFGTYIMSRQLKVNKKHEKWIMFVGRPVRFSLREFGLVTGLPCGPFPKASHKKLKVSIAGKSYWPTLFGMLSSVTVVSVVRILKKRTVTDKDMRIKYACLALLASVLMPTTHNPKIMREHAERIEDLDEFFRYTWGRLAFTMLMTSIKEKKEVSLSQKIIALKGFVYSLQLVMVEAVPALTEVVQLHTSFDSDEDDEKDEDNETGVAKYSLSPSHARFLNEKGEVFVECIIGGDGEIDIHEATYAWSDEDEDPKVDYIVSLINEDFQFNGDMFVGGVTADDVDKMREAEEEAAKETNKKRNTKSKRPVTSVGSTSEPAGNICGLSGEQLHEVGNIVVRKVTDLFLGFEQKVNASIQNVENRLEKHIETADKALAEAVVSRVIAHFQQINQCADCNEAAPVAGDFSPQETCFRRNNFQEQVTTIEQSCGRNTGSPQATIAGNNQHSTLGLDGGDKTQTILSSDAPVVSLDTEEDPQNIIHFPPPSFSLGLTQPQQQQSVGNTVADGVDVPEVGGEDGGDENVLNDRRSKRLKTAPPKLVSDFHCDSRFWQAETEAQMCILKYVTLHEKLKKSWSMTIVGVNVSSKDIAEISCPTKAITMKLMDVLVDYTRMAYARVVAGNAFKKAAFFDTKFVSLLGKYYSRFIKSNDRTSFQFQKQLVDLLNGDDDGNADAERFYFPFNIDKLHWVSVCVDWPEQEVSVLDCNVSMRSDAATVKDVKHSVAMFPFLLKQSGRELPPQDLQPFTIQRDKRIPEHPIYVSTGVVSVLLIGAHAVSGLEGCFQVTPDFLTIESQKIAVSLYETYKETLQFINRVCMLTLIRRMQVVILDYV